MSAKLLLPLGERTMQCFIILPNCSDSFLPKLEEENLNLTLNRLTLST